MVRRLDLARYSVLRLVLIAIVCMLSDTACAQAKNLAPGFDALSRNARIVVMPVDIELFSISAGGIQEPRADWTDTAIKHFKSALATKQSSLGATIVELPAAAAEEIHDINALHAAIAEAIWLHHFSDGSFKLPTKKGELDWSMGTAVAPLRDRTDADYALFTWIRDSYASGERVATMIFYALLTGAVLSGGAQVAYASLVDLKTGRIVWFNRLARMSGDLRELDKATETLNALLVNFPPIQ